MSLLPSPPSAEILAIIFLFYLAGCATPWYYAQERVRGLGRWIVNFLPYEPPPGEKADDALKDAVEAGEKSPTNDDNDETDESNPKQSTQPPG